MQCVYLLSLVLLGFAHAWAWAPSDRSFGRQISSKLALSASSSETTWLAKVNEPPYLAIIAEHDACDSEERMRSTLEAIKAAVSTQKVSLVSVRIGKPKDASRSQQIESRVKELTNKIVKLTETNDFHVVVSSDWIDTLDELSTVGVHFKGMHRNLIPATRERLGPEALVGTSAHSVGSALEAISEYGAPDYFFVGTCYMTTSHPEKDESDLEGPALPGQVSRAIQEHCGISLPVLAIGGIDETNCEEPVLAFGADGVAVISAVLRAADPADAVMQIQASMGSVRDRVQRPCSKKR
jgi:thiamine-phosphate diphosphorylase